MLWDVIMIESEVFVLYVFLLVYYVICLFIIDFDIINISIFFSNVYGLDSCKWKCVFIFCEKYLWYLDLSFVIGIVDV